MRANTGVRAVRVHLPKVIGQEVHMDDETKIEPEKKDAYEIKLPPDWQKRDDESLAKTIAAQLCSMGGLIW